MAFKNQIKSGEEKYNSYKIVFAPFGSCEHSYIYLSLTIWTNASFAITSARYDPLFVDFVQVASGDVAPL